MISNNHMLCGAMLAWSRFLCMDDLLYNEHALCIYEPLITFKMYSWTKWTPLGRIFIDSDTSSGPNFRYRSMLCRTLDSPNALNDRPRTIEEHCSATTQRYQINLYTQMTEQRLFLPEPESGSGGQRCTMASVGQASKACRSLPSQPKEIY